VAFRRLRRGEAVGLPWTDVHLEGGTVTISEQIVQLDGKTERGAPKTDGSARIVALDADTTEVSESTGTSSGRNAPLGGGLGGQRPGVHP
jgi:hypothetical protein